jgi:cytochrome b involved in lipid metabolism
LLLPRRTLLKLSSLQFLPDHPGGKKPMLMMGGKDATEEFEMLHKPEIIDKYGADMLVGTVANAKGVKSSPVGAETSLTLEEIAKHKTADDCWVIVNDKVYDVTNVSRIPCAVFSILLSTLLSPWILLLLALLREMLLLSLQFLPDHPGGKKPLLMMGGKDATEEFEMLHKPEIIDKYGADMLVGTVAAKSRL